MSIVTSSLCGGRIVVHHHGHHNARMEKHRSGYFSPPLHLSLSQREGCRHGKSVILRAQKSEEEYEVLSEMKEWMRHKPPGFGENTTYDTSLEEKLLAEIEQSQKAQLNKEQHEDIVSASVPSGVNVLIGNLPKKKNISRDLQASFKGYPGLLRISPVESGNKKTRDPICKGIAFFVFTNEDVANRFISRYNGESIVFGKIQKRITCSLSSTDGPTESGSKALSTTTMHTIPKLRIRDKEIGFTDCVIKPGIFQDNPNSKLSQNSMNANAKRASEKVIEITPDNSKLENVDEYQSSEGQQEYQNQGSTIAQDSESQTSVSKVENNFARKQNVSSADLSCGVKKQRQKQKAQVKRKNHTAIEIGSAQRLKKKERSVLSAVFTKYGQHTTSTT